MARPFTRALALENAAFVRALRRTGNAAEAARAIGLPRLRFVKRRKRHPAFALEWDAVLALAFAAIRAAPPDGVDAEAAFRTARSPEIDADPHVRRGRDGRWQICRAGRSRIGLRARQAFLTALSATANVRLSCAAAGFSQSGFNNLKRCDPGFAREWRLALEQGYDAVEGALMARHARGASRRCLAAQRSAAGAAHDRRTGIAAVADPPEGGAAAG